MALESLTKSLQLDGACLADGSLLLSVHPDGSRLAAARGPTLCICPLLPRSTPEPANPTSSEAQEQALVDRRATHESAGPGPRRHPTPPSLPPPPLRFACPAASSAPAVSPDDITVLTWLAFARPPAARAAGDAGGEGSPGRGRSSGGGVGGGAEVGGPGSGYRRRTTSSGSGGGGIFASIQMMMEDHELQRQQHARHPHAHPHPGYSLVVLLAGTRGGALQLHDADSGALLLRQQLHPGPVVSIAVRTWRMGLKPDDAVEDVTVGWADAVVRLAAWDLRTAATSCYAAAVAAAEARARGGGGGGSQARFGLWGSSAPSGPDIRPLAVQKWEVPGAARGRSCVVCCGQRPRSLYSLLQGIGTSPSSTATGKTIFLAGGGRPACLAALEVDEQSAGGGGALSYISSVATSVMGLARTARSVAAAPLALGSGLRSFVMNPLQLATGGGASADAAGRTAASGPAGHHQPPPQQPLAVFADASAGQRHPSTGLWRQHRDDGRAVLALAPAPHGSLVAAVDNLGRVLLVEAGAMIVSGVWKGYRDAQIAWLEVPAHSVAGLMRQQQLRQQHHHHNRQEQERGNSQDGEQAERQPEGQQHQGEVDAEGQGVVASGPPALTDPSEPGTDSGGGGGEAQSTETHGVKDGRRRAHGSHHHPSRPPLPTAPVTAAAGAALTTSAATAPPQQPGIGTAAGGPSDTPTGTSGSVVGRLLQPQHLLHPPQKPQPRQRLGAHHGAADISDGGTTATVGDIGDAYVLLLAVYAPRRLTLELWWPLHGGRLAAIAVPPRARLLQRGGGGCGGGELGTWRVADVASAGTPPMTPAGCMMCFWGPAPELGTELAEAAAWEDGGGSCGGGGDSGEGFELLDVASIFGLA